MYKVSYVLDEVIIEGNQKIYMFLNDNCLPVVPVAKYLKYLNSTGKSSNTQKSYCYDLKHFFEFLELIDKDYREISINNVSDFVSWLRNSYKGFRQHYHN